MYYRLAPVINVRGMKKKRTQAPDLKTIKVKESLELVGMDLIGEHQFGYHSFFTSKCVL